LKIVEQSVKLIGLMHPCLFSKEAGDYVTDFDPQKLIEHAGRVCYKSEDKITLDSASKFVEMIAVNQHESVLEHSCASFLIVCDRGVSHEIVRHRIASFSQESTRYCNYGKEKFGKEIRASVFCVVIQKIFILIMTYHFPEVGQACLVKMFDYFV